MSTPGLALEQAPPVNAPFRFFLSAPLFGLVAAGLLLVSGPELLVSRWTPGMLALTHLFTLGVLAMVMFGALLQMLPVVAGAPVAHPVAVATGVHGLLVAGTLALAVGFVRHVPAALQASAVLLALAVAGLLAAALHSLYRAPRRHAAVRGMTFAVVALAVAAALGSWLLAGHGWNEVLLRRGAVTDLHAGWALLGWVGILVAGVAFQVVPMFQMTPEYPEWMARGLNRGLFAALLLWSAGLIWPAAAPLGVAGAALLWLGNALFAVVTLDLQRRRKRRLPDVTLSFWRLGMGCLLATLALWLAGHAAPAWSADPRSALLLGAGLVLGYALSVVNGMLYKIVPFLVWFHLQNRLLQSGLIGTGVKVPNMKKVLPDAVCRRQFRVHAVALALLPPALLWPAPMVYPFAIVIGLSFLLLARNLWAAGLLYRDELRRLDAATG
ncbi:MAG: hypothetical protein R3298_06970 [Gammaproteobacteria bacterium]|nr:hypothetical protein [Gammaproteobacteria bacterium]